MLLMAALLSLRAKGLIGLEQAAEEEEEEEGEERGGKRFES